MRGALVASGLALCASVGCTDLHTYELQTAVAEPRDGGVDLADAAANLLAFLEHCRDHGGPDGGRIEFTSAEMALECFVSALRPGCPAQLIAACADIDTSQQIPKP